MDRIMMKIDDFLGMHSFLEYNISTLGVYRDKAEDFSISWWEGPGAGNLKRSLEVWAIQLQALMDEFDEFFRRIDYEVEEWTTTDLKYDYEGEEIDTKAELGDLLWDLLTGEVKLDELTERIDISEILEEDWPWDWRYPPNSTTVWIKTLGDEWVEFNLTGPDADLSLNLLPTGATLNLSLDAGSADIIWGLGDGWVAGTSFSLLSLEASVGLPTVGPPKLNLQAYVLTVDDFVGKDVDGFGFVGVHVGVNLIGEEIGDKLNEVSISPKDAGAPQFDWVGSLEAGMDIEVDKYRDPTPPGER